eukprot:106201_1
MSKSQSVGLPSTLIVGTGEYVTGVVGGGGTKSDKGCGVVSLVHFDLRKRGKIGTRIALCGTNGSKFPQVREHFRKLIGEKYNLDDSFESYPADQVGRDPVAYKTALESFSPGDVCVIFTPDDTHYDIALCAIKKGLHVMCTKPFTKTLARHKELLKLSRKSELLIGIEVHKRFDPVYSDAMNRIQNLGDFGYFYSYMSQPKFQLQTFKAWAGKSSDISYYLNSHHVDFLCWSLQSKARPIEVRAVASYGVAEAEIQATGCEDTITLTVQWENLESGNLGTSVHTASWSAGTADVHSQQRFYYQGHKGEVTADQAHRGYTVAEDGESFKSVNPLYMRYTPSPEGDFVGQNGYGYMSFEAFIDAVNEIRCGRKTSEDFDSKLPTAASTLWVTAILEGGRRSLDDSGKAIKIVYDENDFPNFEN